RRARAALELAAGLGEGDRAVEVARGQRRLERLEPLAVGPEADDDEPRLRDARQDERPGGEQQVDALADDQLADEDDEPVAARAAAARARRRRPSPTGARRCGASRRARPARCPGPRAPAPGSDRGGA